MDHLKLELSKKDAELYTLHTQMETLQKQTSDHQHHIRVLREQVEAKDQQSTLIQSEVGVGNGSGEGGGGGAEGWRER